MYGLTLEGGSNNTGVLFEYIPSTSAYAKKLDFTGAINGGVPRGPLTQALNGRLYGRTASGGANNQGVLFEYDPGNSTYTKKLDLSGSPNLNGSLTLAPNGRLYGMTYGDDIDTQGTIFEYDPSVNGYIKKLVFDGASKGANPNGSLTLASNGKFYGMTSHGGVGQNGVIFEYDLITDSYLKRLDFDGATKGSYPSGDLVQAANGKLYGMTNSGGANSIGVLFEFDPSTSIFLKKLDFNGTNGNYPNSSLTLASNGKLYGMTPTGGLNFGGVLFEYDPATSVYVKKIDFDGVTTGGYPYGSLTQSPNGKLYGMTSTGGTSYLGTLFEFDPLTSAFTVKLNFNGTNGSDAESSLTFVKGAQVITFNSLPSKNFGDPTFALTATASSGLPVSYTSSNLNVATISGNTVTVIGAGTTTITASQSGDADYLTAPPVLQTLTVNKSSQTITFNSLTPVNFGDPTFNLSATSSSGLAVSFASSNPAVATVSGNVVTIVGGGTTNIAASQTGNANYNAAAILLQPLTVNKINQTITFNAISPKTMGPPFSLTGTSSSSLALSYASSDLSVATVSGSTVTLIGVGATTITASQSGNANYNAAADVPQTLTVTKGSQTITFSSLPSKAFGDPAFALTGSVASGLSLSYISSNTSVATISGNTVTIVGAGSTTITASQAGNANYTAATDVLQTLTVNKGNQTITFNTLAAVTTTNPPVTLSATTSSGLPATYTSSSAAVASIAGNILTIVGPGTSTITASQAGDANYNAATSVTQLLTVMQTQTISFGAILAKAFGDAAFALAATTNSALAISYTSSNTSVATVGGSTVTILAAGTTNITASQAGNASFLPATNVVQLLTISKGTNIITIVAITTKTLGDPAFNVTATASSNFAVTLSTTSDKVTLSGNQITIVKAGSVTINADQAGNANINAATKVSQTFCINPAKPTITLSGANTESTVLTSGSSMGNQWYLNGAAMTGETNGTLAVKKEGSYTVNATADNCVSQTSAAQVVVVTGDLKNTKENEDLIIFPNPVKEKLIIQLNGFETKPVELMMYDMNGKAIEQTTGQGKGEVTLDVSKYATGKYILRASQKEKITQKHFVKE